MKPLFQISKECNLPYNLVYLLCRNEKIIPAKKVGRRIFFDKYQEEIIHTILYFSGHLEEIILESKMNIPETIETFAEFKKRVYT